MEKWYIYILYSDKIDKHYVGSTKQIIWRLKKYNLEWGKYTNTVNLKAYI